MYDASRLTSPQLHTLSRKSCTPSLSTLTITMQPTTTTTAAPSYPPSAHTTTPSSAQPAPSPTMAVSQEPAKKEKEAMRLRGGCIPCPVSIPSCRPPYSLTPTSGRRLLLHHPPTMLLLKNHLLTIHAYTTNIHAFTDSVIVMYYQYIHTSNTSLIIEPTYFCLPAKKNYPMMPQ
jgi:hypothetical protein